MPSGTVAEIVTRHRSGPRRLLVALRHSDCANGLRRSQQRAAQAIVAVEQELARLFVGGPAIPYRVAAVASFKGGSIQIAEQADHKGLREQITATVYGGAGGWL